MLLAVAALAAALATPVAQTTPTPSPQRVLALIRNQFRSHRPPPPFVAYTLVRTQRTDRGFPDYVGSYVYHIWLRSSDRAALGRKVFRDFARGELEFMRPAFNEPRDPGPPTADVFEPAPVRPRPVSEVPTPEPSSTYQVIGSVAVTGEYDYFVDSVDREGDDLHLRLRPVRDPERNRLRELWADARTYELHRMRAHDRLFDFDGKVYGVVFDIRLAMLDGRPVVTGLHGVVGDGYQGDGKDVDFAFNDITFPKSLPDWYFDARSYAAHRNDAPS